MGRGSGNGMDETQFKEEARALRPVLAREARRYSGSADEAEDIVQDALLRLWQIRAELRSPMAALARVLVRNLSIDALRSRKYTVSVEAMDVGDSPTDDDSRYERVMLLLAQLPPWQQTIFRMRHMEGLDYADIAEMTGTSAAAVRQVVSRARRTILQRYTSLSCKTNN